ncbi:MAG: FtsX-like permease family protein, partial [Clostridia bacterium]|nr:FtsX-like permease family protein [Clostridia bacterium]
VIHNIRVSTDGLQIIKTKNMLSGIADTLSTFVWFVYIFAAMLLVLTLIVLSVVFSITVNERKKEFAVIRALGGTKAFVLSVIFKESLAVSVSGGLAGALAAAAVVFPFSTHISDVIGLPYLQPKLSVILLILIVSVLAAFSVGPLAALGSVSKISKAEAYLTMREEE